MSNVSSNTIGRSTRQECPVVPGVASGINHPGSLCSGTRGYRTDTTRRPVRKPNNRFLRSTDNAHTLQDGNALHRGCLGGRYAMGTR